MAFQANPFGDPFSDPFASKKRSGSSGGLSYRELQDLALSVPSEVTPEQQESITDKAIAGTLGAASSLGNLLWLPGSSALDLVASVSTGEWHNPFDQWLSPTSSENRITGRELLTKWGADPNKETGISGWFDDPMEGVRDVAGFGLEMLFDPLSYASGFAIPMLSKGRSALSSTGRAMEKAGLLDDAAEVLQRSRKIPIEVGDEAAEITAKNVEAKMSVGFREARGKVTPRMILEDEVLKARYGEEELLTRVLDAFDGPGIKEYQAFERKVLNASKTVLTDSEKANLIARFEKVNDIVSKMPDEKIRSFAADVLNKNFDDATSIADVVNELKKRMIPKNLLDSLDETMGGSLKVGLPFTDTGSILSPFGGRVSKRMDSLERWIKSTVPGGAFATAFDYAARGASSAGHAAARHATRLMDFRSRAVNEAMATHYKLREGLRETIEQNVRGESGQVKDMLEVLGHKKKTGIISESAGSTPTKELETGDFIKTKRTRKTAQVIGPHTRMGADGVDQPGILVREFDRESGEYVNKWMSQAEAKAASVINKPENIPGNWAEDSLEQALQVFIRASKEVGFDDALEHIKIKDVYGVGGELSENLKYADVMGFSKGKARDRVKELIDAMNSAESKIVSRMKSKGVDVGLVSKTSFHYGARNVTPRIEKVIEREGNWVSRFGPDVSQEEILFSGKSRAVVDDPEYKKMLESYQSETLQMGRDPAVANLPVFVIERMLSDPMLGKRAFNRIARKYEGQGLPRNIAEENAVKDVHKYLLESKEYRKWIDNSVDAGKGNALRKNADELLAKEGMDYFDMAAMDGALEQGKKAYTLKYTQAQRDAHSAFKNALAQESAARESALNLLYGGLPSRTGGRNIGFIEHYRDHAGGWAGPMYARDYVISQSNYFKELAKLESLHDASMMAVANHIKYAVRTNTTETRPGNYTVGELFRKLGHNLQESQAIKSDALVNIKSPEDSVSYLKKLLDNDTYRLAVGPKENAAEAAARGISLRDIQLEETENLLNFGIDKELFDSLVSTKKIVSDPEWKKSFLTFVDRATSIFKGNVTLPFPAFANRNWLSGQFVNVTSGDVKTPADFLLYLKCYAECLFAGRNPTQAASQDFFNNLRTLSVLGNKHLDDVEYVGNFRAAFAGRMGSEAAPKSVRGMWSKRGRAEAWEETEDYLAANPNIWKRLYGGAQPSSIDEMGMGLADKTALRQWRFWLAQGSRYNQMVEYMNRGPMYKYLIKKGYNPGQAANKVRRLQFDYGRLTDFERNVMRRAIPFYAFTRNMTPLFFDTLIDRPGGVLGQTIRASGQGTDVGQVLPDYVTAQTAVPSPFTPEEEGAKSWITKFGLAHEDPLSYFQRFGGGLVPGLTGMAYQVGSRLNPMPKLAIELLSGQSLFQTGPSGRGRSLDELNPTIAQLRANIAQGGGFIPSWETGQFEKPDPFGGQIVETTVGNLPISRGLSFARQMLDPRKSWLEKGVSAFTGLGQTTLSPYQMRRARQKAIEQLVTNAGIGDKFQNINIDKEKLLKQRQDARIAAGTELDALPGRFSMPALLIAEQRRLRREGKEFRDKARQQREEQFRNYVSGV